MSRGSQAALGIVFTLAAACAVDVPEKIRQEHARRTPTAEQKAAGEKKCTDLWSGVIDGFEAQRVSGFSTAYEHGGIAGNCWLLRDGKIVSLEHAGFSANPFEWGHDPGWENIYEALSEEEIGRLRTAAAAEAPPGGNVLSHFPRFPG